MNVPEITARTIDGMIAVRPPHHRRPIAEPLLHDWRWLARRREALDGALLATGWRPPGSAAADPAGCDEALAELVREARSDSLAARVVLQRLLPGLVAIAKRRAGRRPHQAYEALDELVGAGWIVIRCFPIERRPHHVAANLLRDIEYETFTRGPRRVMVHREIPSLLDEDLSAPGNRSTFDEVVEVLGDGVAARMRRRDIEFAAALASGYTLSELAARRGQTHRAVQYRRRRVAARLRVATLGWDVRDAP